MTYIIGFFFVCVKLISNLLSFYLVLFSYTPKYQDRLQVCERALDGRPNSYLGWWVIHHTTIHNLWAQSDGKPTLHDLGRSFPKWAAAGGAARSYKQAPLNAVSTLPLSAAGRLTTCFPLLWCRTHMYHIESFFCNVNRKKPELNNIRKQRR